MSRDTQGSAEDPPGDDAAIEESDIPYLFFKDAPSEFMELADAFAIVHNVRIPMHSHFLAQTSKFFAQLFASISRSEDAPTDLSELFKDYDLSTVLLTVYLMYGSHRIHDIFPSVLWAGYRDISLPNLSPSQYLLQIPFEVSPGKVKYVKITKASMEQVFSLVDKLDTPFPGMIDMTILKGKGGRYFDSITHSFMWLRIADEYRLPYLKVLAQETTTWLIFHSTTEEAMTLFDPKKRDSEIQQEMMALPKHLYLLLMEMMALHYRRDCEGEKKIEKIFYCSEELMVSIAGLEASQESGFPYGFALTAIEGQRAFQADTDDLAADAVWHQEQEDFNAEWGALEEGQVEDD